MRRRLNWKPGKELFLQMATAEEAPVDPLLGRTKKPALGALAVLGYAKTFRKCRPTEEWMKELREGEQE